MESNNTFEFIRSRFTSKDKINIDDYVNNILESYISQTPIPIDKAVITKMLGDDPDPF